MSGVFRGRVSWVENRVTPFQIFIHKVKTSAFLLLHHPTPSNRDTEDSLPENAFIQRKEGGEDDGGRKGAHGHLLPPTAEKVQVHNKQATVPEE